MSNAVDTLLYTIKNGSFHIDGARIVFLNAVLHTDLSVMAGADIVFQQSFKPDEIALKQADFTAQPSMPEDQKSYDSVCLLLPPNITEARYLIAKGAQLLRADGVLLCAADNKAGGGRIKKLMAQFGFDDLHDEARHKARAVWGRAHHLNQDEISKACAAGEKQRVLEGRFLSQAGIFGWDKIDKGSEILTHHIPPALKGRGADFGCGYGYLSHYLLSHCSKIKALTCLDAEHKAVTICRENLMSFNVPKDFLWCDLTKPQETLRNLDFIVMNPPFHSGKKTDITIGQNFIETAHRALRRNGQLWMVANAHLPYENSVTKIFFAHEKLYEGRGYKVWCCTK